MSTEQKTVEGDDSVSFTDLENNFARVVQELVNDKSLEKFRIEYEKLHEALMTSHEHNEVLVKKCKQLNEDILKHSKQIGSIIVMTQADQRTIGNLRCEFEKAWKIIEASNEKEQRSRNIILALKTEIENLSQLISQGGAIQEEQTTSKQTLEDETALLKQEIDGNEKILNDLRQQLDTAQMETAKMEGVIKKLKPEIDDSSQELEECLQSIENLTQEAVHIQMDMKDVQKDIEDNENKKEEMKQQEGNMKQKLKDMKKEILDHKRSIKGLEDSLSMQQAQTNEKRKLLVKEQRATNVTEGRHKELSKIVDEKLNEKNEYPEMLRKLNREFDDLQNDLNEMKRYKSEISAVKMEYRKAMQENRNVALDIQNSSNWEELEARKYRLQGDHADKNIREMQNAIQISKKEKAQEIVHQRAVSNDITNQKGSIHSSRHIAANLQDDIKDNIDNMHDAVNNRNEVMEIIQDRNNQIDQLNVQLSYIGNDIKYVDSIKEVMRTDRDTLNRQYKTELVAIKAMEVECETVKKETNSLKEEIRKLDDSTAREHLAKLGILEEIETLQQEAEEYKRQTAEILKKIELIKEQIGNQAHVLREADKDTEFLTKTNEDIKLDMATIKNKIAAKVVERKDQQSQILVLHNQMNRYHNAYDEALQLIDDRKNELYFLVDKRDKLMYKCKVLEALKKEKTRCEKELIDAQSKVVALEEELQNPISVNKWIFLEATNPEVAQLLHMKYKILDEMAKKMAVTQRLNQTRSDVSTELQKLEKDMQKRKGTSYSTQYKYYSEVLKNKTKQLIKLEDQYNQRNSTVVEKKADISTVRGELRTERTELVDLKDKISTIRASTANNRDRFRRGIHRFKGETVFVGGGFAYQGSPEIQLVVPPLQMNASIRVQSQKARANSPTYSPRSFLPKLKMNPQGYETPRVKFVDENEPENPVRPPTYDPNTPRSARRPKRDPTIEVN